MQRRAVQCRGFCFWFWVLGLGVGLGTAGTGSTGAGTPAVSSATALVATEKLHPGFYPQWHGSRPRKTSPMMRQASWSDQSLHSQSDFWHTTGPFESVHQSPTEIHPNLKSGFMEGPSDGKNWLTEARRGGLGYKKTNMRY